MTKRELEIVRLTKDHALSLLPAPIQSNIEVEPASILMRDALERLAKNSAPIPSALVVFDGIEPVPSVKSDPIYNIDMKNLLNDLYPSDRIRIGDFLKRLANK